jgi:uncharacterized coiled-coil protein SlyX
MRTAHDTLSRTRATVTRRLSGLEIHQAFQLATIASATNAHTRTTKSAVVSRRRLLAKAERLASVEAV